MAVYNGAGHTFWRDVWIGDKSLLSIALREISTKDSLRKVHDY